ncbi:MAG: hypothetical protein NTW25_02810 [Candidatus Kapabacteria bacterium]|nr:hypothetical protein [Candidatus Kapabacteria bacterium]
MIKFTLIEIEAIKGKQKFFKLFKNEKCDFDTFEKDVRINFNSEMNKIYALMDRVANLESLPQSMFKDITPFKDKTKEYEIKTHHLRVYLIQEAKTGKIIVTGGYKNSQKIDINHFRELKRQYLNNNGNL